MSRSRVRQKVESLFAEYRRLVLEREALEAKRDKLGADIERLNEVQAALELIQGSSVMDEFVPTPWVTVEVDRPVDGEHRQVPADWLPSVTRMYQEAERSVYEEVIRMGLISADAN